MNATLDRIDRGLYRDRAVRFSHHLARRCLRLQSAKIVMIGRGLHATPTLRILDGAIDKGDITWDEVMELDHADVIISATSADRRSVYVLGEIAPTIRRKHRDNAVRKAAMLERATSTLTIAVTIGMTQDTFYGENPIFMPFDPDGV